ncbi:hypothetical protein [Mesorhizobium ciceri]|uniref:hypothetical protein n=1 Tax=Mesorhizobium ciceri TaxID=39645 RepID=UPI001FD95B30|nr:hypothetical protein [Mesorhizobium ciceri]
MTNFVLVGDGVVLQSDRSGAEPEGFVEAPDEVCPGYLFDGQGFSPPIPQPIPPPDRVSARQFRMQLRKSGLLAAVTGWVAAQNPLVQDSFQYSSTFVRSEPMMAAGFAALGFTEEQVDQFFAAAADL